MAFVEAFSRGDLAVVRPTKHDLSVSLAKTPSPISRRLLPLVAAFLPFVALSTLLRTCLFVAFGRGEGAGLAEVARVMLTGLRMDATVAVVCLALPAAWLLLIPERLFTSKLHRLALHAALAAGLALLPFTLLIEWFFFEEFDARFNTVAVDYLLYPYEVGGTIRDSYPLGWILAACALAGVIQWALLRRTITSAWHAPSPLAGRLRDAVVVAGAAVVLTATVNAGTTRGHRTRVLDELSDNGVHAFARALTTRDLDYAANYVTLPHDEAWARVNARLGTSGASSLERALPGDPARKRLNVVLVLEESLGSEFWGSLGRPGASLTPEMDDLAKDGVLFTAMHATGNRTVRGMEGVLASFPPLPGDSIVRRTHSEHVETIARLLRRDSYETTFVYGGRGVFDDMRAFTTQNGWSRFIEQPDFADPAHVTIWGVSDEDLFGRCLEEMRDARERGTPFLVTALTVSNHKPFTFPDGRIHPPDGLGRRARAVMYTDWALARFLKQARDEGFWQDTIFAVVADHGARVYGSQTIPLKSYEIPFVLFGPPDVVPAGARIGVPGSSIDVAPTIVGRLGRPARTVFFGRDLLADEAALEPGLIPMHHDHDVGLLGDDALVVLGLQQHAEVYEMAADGVQAPTPLSAPRSGDMELIRDAQAVFQVADEVYLDGRYRVASDPP